MMCLEDSMVDEILHLWKTMLELVRHQEATETSTNRENFDLSWSLRKVFGQLEGFFSCAIRTRCCAIGMYSTGAVDDGFGS